MIKSTAIAKSSTLFDWNNGHSVILQHEIPVTSKALNLGTTLKIMASVKNYMSKKNIILVISLLFSLSMHGQTFGQAVNSNTAYKNLALNKPSRQSTTSYGGNASRANDGNTNGNMDNRSVSHTEKRHNSWWEVDLGKEYQIFEVVVYNRTDCCSDRLSNFDIWVTKEPRERIRTRVVPFASEEYSLKNKRSKRYTGKESGRYVRIELNGSNILQLAEIQVFGTKLGKMEIKNIRNSVMYNYSVFSNGTRGEANITREVTNGVSAGYDFSKTVDKSHKKFWDIGVTSKVELNGLIASASLEISNKYGEESNIRKEDREGTNYSRSTASTETSTQKIPGGCDRYVFTKFVLKEVPVIYKVGNQSFSWVRILEQAPSQKTTIIDVANGVIPDLLIQNNEQWITEANYEEVWKRYLQSKNNRR